MPMIGGSIYRDSIRVEMNLLGKNAPDLGSKNLIDKMTKKDH